MVTLQAIIELINARKKRLLDVAEFALPPERFLKFRKVTLDEFGRNGLEADLARLLGKSQDRDG